MPRTKLSKNIKKSENINFPVTIDQKQLLIKKSEKHKKSVAEYVRFMLFENNSYISKDIVVFLKKEKERHIKLLSVMDDEIHRWETEGKLKMIEIVLHEVWKVENKRSKF